MNLFQRLNRVMLLCVLLICLAIKVVHAYAFITGIDDNGDRISNISPIVKIEPVIEKPQRTEVVSSNILMVWSEGDNRIGHYSFNHDEFSKLQFFAKVVGSEEMESIFRQHREHNKEVLLAYVERRLEEVSDSNLYVYNKDKRRKDGEL